MALAHFGCGRAIRENMTKGRQVVTLAEAAHGLLAVEVGPRQSEELENCLRGGAAGGVCKTRPNCRKRPKNRCKLHVSR